MADKKYYHIYYLKNKEKIISRAKKWYEENKSKIIERNKIQSKMWHRQNPKKCRAIEKRYRKTHPWAQTYLNIVRRCNSNPFYLKKKIRYFITVTELKKLWFRDKPYLMKTPTIDRKDNNGNYTFDNCRYVELVDNLKNRQFKHIPYKKLKED